MASSHEPMNLPNSGGRTARPLAPARLRFIAWSVSPKWIDGCIEAWYTATLIKSCQDKTTQDIYDGINTKAARKVPRGIHRRAKLLLDVLDSAHAVTDMASPPGTRLEKLKGDLAGFYSVRINDQWRIIFKFHDGDVYEVRITDYH